MAQLRPFQDDQPLRTATLFRFDFEKPEWTGAIEIVSWAFQEDEILTQI